MINATALVIALIAEVVKVRLLFSVLSFKGIFALGAYAFMIAFLEL
jgi:hypothetical protein